MFLVPQYFRVPYNILVHDENGSIVEGDVVTLRPERYSRRVFHHVNSIVAPFEKPVDQRPPLYTREEYLADRAKEKEEKLERKEERLRQGVVAGKSGPQKLVDAGGKKGPDGKGRQVMPGGEHKFGSINEEAITGKRRTQQAKGKVSANQEDLAKVQKKPQKDIQKPALGNKVRNTDRRLI